MSCTGWLLPEENAAAEAWLLQGVKAMMADYLKSSPAEARSPVSRSEIAGWASEAERWAPASASATRTPASTQDRLCMLTISGCITTCAACSVQLSLAGWRVTPASLCTAGHQIEAAEAYTQYFLMHHYFVHIAGWPSC